jgi:asparagine synthase (glutamine-hydrolysing)
MAARDFVGRRTLFHATSGGVLLVASTVEAVLADGTVSRELSMTTLATVASGLWSHSSETGYRAVHELPAGHMLTAEAGATPRIVRAWYPPEGAPQASGSLEDAGAELRSLLVGAVDQRLARTGPTSISLSGGWDSPAVFAAGQLALRHSAGERSLHAVSLSYPPGDPGREDELIARILEPFGASTSWIDVDSVPVLHDAAGGAARRDVPFAHAYEHWNRELARGARRTGAHIMLDGAGGDQLFQVSGIYLADLFRTLRWRDLRHEFRLAGGRGPHALYRAAIRPALPNSVTGLIARLRGTVAPPHYLDRRPPPWIRAAFLREHGVLEREDASRPSLPHTSHVVAEAHAFLVFPYFARVMGCVSALARNEGVEMRSPLLDERIVRFAVPRPWHERVHRGETKRTLRAAMRGVLPDDVLAPRARRTGVTSAYLVRRLRTDAAPYLRSMTAGSHLAALGLLDPARFRLAWEHFLAHEDDELAGRLFLTLQTELWLRARSP